jgi:glutamine---fructose-6-phosphate transaminase (isomerizing)
MCGIFGIVSSGNLSIKDLRTLAKHARQRGRDSSGFFLYHDGRPKVFRADYDVTKLLNGVKPFFGSLAMGHSRLITDGLSDNQPVVRRNICVLHNGIVVNHEELWKTLRGKRELEIDSEVIAAIAEDYLEGGGELDELPQNILRSCEGSVACVIALPSLGKMCLFSNNGSLYIGNKKSDVLFASEKFPLEDVGCTGIEQVTKGIFLDIPLKKGDVEVIDRSDRTVNLIPKLSHSKVEEALLQYATPELRRCTKCILPETMPYIRFDEAGVCNFCHNYTLRNVPKPKTDLFELVAPYRRQGNDCIVPFSGGRDSCYGLHLIVNELKMKPITYTYDWGMVTDLGRRNISRMCAELGVENIIVAADISKKRNNIAMNLKAWLKSPHLGMLSVLTAGDKHFFRHVETVRKQTGIDLNLWGVNPLEVTHFKAGFLGVAPDFEEERVYSHGIGKQLHYQNLRLKAMLDSPGYFNGSLWDTLSGEYYRSFKKQTHYYHIFDYWKWDEKVIEDVLDEYKWERATDTSTTWRIGDGTAAFYNYVYYTVAGFSEHDTFRSNQIREGDLTREEALDLVIEENRPRYPNIKWYLDALGFEFADVVSVINAIPKLYERGKEASLS